MILLGVESSCDETAAAIVADDPAHPDGPGRILAHIVRSQIEDHECYGGVVPEIAARAHLDHVEPVVARCLADAGLRLADLDGVAAAVGPGLIGGLIVGASFAKGLALAARKPFVAVNHLEAHALTCRLALGVRFPFLLLLVSGGHCQLALARGVGDWRKLGGTIDDAVGEAFDKTAKMLGLGFPGGPAVEQAALRGDPERFVLPRPMVGRPNCDFSFSGLKTAVRHAAESIVATSGGVSDQDAADLCAAFQRAVAASLADRVGRAIALVGDDLRAAHGDDAPALVVAGGVAANQALRSRLEQVAARGGLRLVAPPLGLCTDNGAMIAWAGLERLRLGCVDGLEAACRPRWPLESLTPAKGLGPESRLQLGQDAAILYQRA